LSNLTLAKFYPGVGYRFRTIQVYPLQCATADCNRPAVQQATTPSNTSSPTTRPAAAASTAFSVPLIVAAMLLLFLH
jgi:hypothetical protein